MRPVASAATGKWGWGRCSGWGGGCGIGCSQISGTWWVSTPPEGQIGWGQDVTGEIPTVIQVILHWDIQFMYFLLWLLRSSIHLDMIISLSDAYFQEANIFSHFTSVWVVASHADSLGFIAPGLEMYPWEFCLHPNAMEVNWVLFVVLKALKITFTKSAAHAVSFHSS